MQLNVKDALSAKNVPSYAVPKIVGYYSLDKDRNFHPDLSQLRYFVAPSGRKVNFNLNKGFEQFVDKAPNFERDEKVDHLLKFIETHFEKLAKPDQDRVLPYDFICLRGVLKRLMMATFQKEDWSVCAINFKGSIYMWICEKEYLQYPDQEKFVHWGCQFKNYMFGKTPNSESDGDIPANSNEEFCVMFSSLVNNASILHGVKIDGVDSDTIIGEDNETLDGVKLVEVKTSRIVFNHKNVRKSYAMKALKWFSQGFLVGMEDIYLGFRDNQGIVQEVVKTPIKSLPDEAFGLWNKNGCLKFMDAFLQFLRKTIPDESDPHTAWVFDYDCESRVVTVRKEENKKELLFLPDWYVDMINKNNWVLSGFF